MTRSTRKLILLAGLLLACWSTAACVSTAVRRLTCTYDAAAAAAAAKGPAAGHRGAVRSVFFSRDGTRIVSSGAGGRVLMWELERGASRDVLTPLDGPVSLAYAENQQALALAVDGRDDLDLFDARRGEPRSSLAGAASGGLNPFPGHAFSRDGALIAVPRAEAEIQLWNIKLGQVEVELDGHGARVNDLCFAPDDRLLATAGEDGTVRLWDTESGEQAHSFVPHGGTPVTAVDFSADGERIATANAHGIVAVSGIESSAPDLVFDECPVEGGAVRALRFSPSGKAIFGVKRSGCEAQFVCVWDAETGDAAAAIEVPVTDAIDFSADGALMATGGCGCEIILWDLESGAPAGQLGATCRMEVEGVCD